MGTRLLTAYLRVYTLISLLRTRQSKGQQQKFLFKSSQTKSFMFGYLVSNEKISNLNKESEMLKCKAARL